MYFFEFIVILKECFLSHSAESITRLQTVKWEADLALQAFTYIKNIIFHENEHIQEIFSRYMVKLDMRDGEKVRY